MPTLSEFAKEMNEESVVETEVVSAVNTDPVETLRPLSQAKAWPFYDEGGTLLVTYVQKPLSFFGKMEFFALLGKALDDAMKTDGALDVGALMSAATDVDQADAEAIMLSFARLAIYVPDLLKNCYCIWLNVPRDEREFAKETMEVGLSDDDAFEMIEVFLDQNSEALADFFVKRLPAVWARVQSRVGPGKLQSSKRSKGTRGRTRKQ